MNGCRFFSIYRPVSRSVNTFEPKTGPALRFNRTLDCRFPGRPDGGITPSAVDFNPRREYILNFNLQLRVDG